MRPGKTSFMQLATKTKVLGIYLIVLSLYQIALFSWPGGPPNLLDPRGGIRFLTAAHAWSLWFERATAGWLLAMGVAISWRGRLLKTYVISELCLASPTFLFVIVFGPEAFRLTRFLGDLLIVCFVLLVFTLVPLCLAIHILLQRRKAVVL
ncbi:MAG: hypothetical protein DMG21_13760 [Acidobacteria bacterium]|nr:MAG: hypothetical protein DMG21_13760 [Acidobacteriota bacterium]